MVLVEVVLIGASARFSGVCFRWKQIAVALEFVQNWNDQVRADVAGAGDPEGLREVRVEDAGFFVFSPWVYAPVTKLTGS